MCVLVIYSCRAAQLGAGQVPIDDNGPDEMFSLKAVTGGKTTLKRVLDVQAPGEQDLEVLELPDSDDDDYGGGVAGGDLADDSDDDSALRYEMEMEDALEDSYKQYLERKGHREDLIKVRPQEVKASLCVRFPEKKG